MPKFLAYGTLRKGSYNYDKCKMLFDDEYNVVGTTAIDVPYLMVCTNNTYPLLIRSEKTNSIIFDVVECSEEAFNFIAEMERQAGYNQAIINGHTIFYHPQWNAEHFATSEKLIIKSGDWLEYEKQLA